MSGRSLQRIEECEQAILRFEAHGLLRRKQCELGERRHFECDVGVQIDLGRLDRLMSEPQGDHRDIDAGLKELHGGGVAKNMPRYPLLP